MEKKNSLQHPLLSGSRGLSSFIYLLSVKLRKKILRKWKRNASGRNVSVVTESCTSYLFSKRKQLHPHLITPFLISQAHDPVTVISKQADLADQLIYRLHPELFI